MNNKIDESLNNPNSKGNEPTLASHGFVFESDNTATLSQSTAPMMSADAAASYPNSNNATLNEYTQPELISPFEHNNSGWYSLNGRIGRVKLLAYSAIWGLISSVLLIIGAVAFNEALLNSVMTGVASVAPIILGVFLLPIYVYSMVILPRRRLHDINKSGWWLLLYLVPLASLVLLYWLYIKAGDSSKNKYGLPPSSATSIEKLLALLMPVLALLIVLAAMLMPSQLVDQFNPVSQNVVVEPLIVAEPAVVEAMLDAEQSAEVADKPMLNTNPEQDPEVQAAIAAALGKPLDNPAQYQEQPQQTYQDGYDYTDVPPPPSQVSPVNYEQFVEAAAVPILIEREPPRTDASMVPEIGVEQ